MLKAKIRILNIFLLSMISITIINCSDDPVSPTVDTADFRYPFTDGSSWQYIRTITISDIRPDSIQHYFLNNPVVITGTVRILYDTVINSVLTKCFLDEYTEDGITRSGRYYYINNDTALILYTAVSNPGNGLFPLSTIRNNNILSSGISGFFSDNSGSSSNQGNTLSSTLKYPIVPGTEWSFINGPTNLTRKYLDFENVNVPNGETVSCMKEVTTYTSIPNDPIYNYYSKFGLMKRTQFVNDFLFSTISNPTGIGYIDINDVSEIQSYNIVLP